MGNIMVAGRNPITQEMLSQIKTEIGIGEVICLKDTDSPNPSANKTDAWRVVKKYPHHMLLERQGTGGVLHRCLGYAEYYLEKNKEIG